MQSVTYLALGGTDLLLNVTLAVNGGSTLVLARLHSVGHGEATGTSIDDVGLRNGLGLASLTDGHIVTRKVSTAQRPLDKAGTKGLSLIQIDDDLGILVLVRVLEHRGNTLLEFVIWHLQIY